MPCTAWTEDSWVHHIQTCMRQLLLRYVSESIRLREFADLEDLGCVGKLADVAKAKDGDNLVPRHHGVKVPARLDVVGNDLQRHHTILVSRWIYRQEI